jgi:hypothetical protein
MKTVKDFQYYVAITPQDTISIVASCPECGMTMTFSDSGAGIQIQYSLQSHQCYQKIVSVPK